MVKLVIERTTTFQFDKLASELGIDPELMVKITARNCTNQANEQSARFEIIKCWLYSQDSSEKAYVLMGEALIRAGLKLIAREVCNYSPTMKSKRPSTGNHLDTSSRKRTKTEMLVTGL